MRTVARACEMLVSSKVTWLAVDFVGTGASSTVRLLVSGVVVGDESVDALEEEAVAAEDDVSAVLFCGGIDDEDIEVWFEGRRIDGGGCKGLLFEVDTSGLGTKLVIGGGCDCMFSIKDFVGGNGTERGCCEVDTSFAFFAISLLGGRPRL